MPSVHIASFKHNECLVSRFYMVTGFKIVCGPTFKPPLALFNPTIWGNPLRSPSHPFPRLPTSGAASHGTSYKSLAAYQLNALK